jgi:hypothetical protein
MPLSLGHQSWFYLLDYQWPIFISCASFLVVYWIIDLSLSLVHQSWFYVLNYPWHIFTYASVTVLLIGLSMTYHHIRISCGSAYWIIHDLSLLLEHQSWFCLLNYPWSIITYSSVMVLLIELSMTYLYCLSISHGATYWIILDLSSPTHQSLFYLLNYPWSVITYSSVMVLLIELSMTYLYFLRISHDSTYWVVHDLSSPTHQSWFCLLNYPSPIFIAFASVMVLLIELSMTYLYCLFISHGSFLIIHDLSPPTHQPWFCLLNYPSPTFISCSSFVVLLIQLFMTYHHMYIGHGSVHWIIHDSSEYRNSWT